MKTRFFVSVLLVASCYTEGSGISDRDIECDVLPAVCESDGVYDTCAEFSDVDDPCAWHKCLVFNGQHGEWVERRICLREVCGIPFDDKCYAQYQALMADCFENKCTDVFDAMSCASLDEEAQKVCN